MTCSVEEVNLMKRHIKMVALPYVQESNNKHTPDDSVTCGAEETAAGSTREQDYSGP